MRILIHFSKCGDFLLTVPRHRSRGGQTILGGMAGSTLTICGGFLLTVPRHHNRGGQTILGGMVGSTLKTCGDFLLTVPQSLGTVAEEDRRSWTGWPGRP